MAKFRAKLNPFTGQLQLVNDIGILFFKESVPTYANLPITGNSKNDARITDDTGHLYVWSLDVPDGALTDWYDCGDIIDLKWAAIEGKPSSAVADIDDAVTKRHVQGTDISLGLMAADIDMNDHSLLNLKDESISFKGGDSLKRSDYLYTRDLVAEIQPLGAETLTYWIDPALGDDGNPGTELLPFKTIQHAINISPRVGVEKSSNYKCIWINLKPGTYTESVYINNFVIPVIIMGATWNPTDVIWNTLPGLYEPCAIELDDCGTFFVGGVTFNVDQDNGIAVVCRDTKETIVQNNLYRKTAGKINTAGIGSQAYLGSGTVFLVNNNLDAGVEKVKYGVIGACVFVDYGGGSNLFGEIYVHPDSLLFKGSEYNDLLAKKHTQNTDQKLDEGGVNEVVVADVKDAVDKKHERQKDTKLDLGGLNEIDVTEIQKKLLVDVDYYVDPVLGDDGNPGTDLLPFKTIQKAVSVIPKDLNNHYGGINLKPGTYLYNWLDRVLIKGFFNGSLYINSSTYDPDDVLLQGADVAFWVEDCEANVQFYALSIRLTSDGLSCINFRNSRGWVSTCLFGDTPAGGTSNTSGVSIDNLSYVCVDSLVDLDTDKVRYGLQSQFGSIMEVSTDYPAVFGDNNFGWGDFPMSGIFVEGRLLLKVSDYEDAIAKKHEHLNKVLLDTYTQLEADLADAVAKKHDHTNKAILDSIEEALTTLLKNSYDTAVAKMHDQNTDIALRTNKLIVDVNGNTEIAGELKIKVYSQDTEPTLGADQRIAMWIDTDDSNRVYLIFRRGVGDQVAVELG